MKITPTLTPFAASKRSQKGIKTKSLANPDAYMIHSSWNVTEQTESSIQL